MFSIAKPKFEKSQKVKLRESLNFWLDKKTLGHFSKGHVFEVIVPGLPSHKYEEALEAFNEDGEIINPEFFYELQDLDGRIITAYEGDLKRVKVVLPEDLEDEEPDENDKLPGKDTSRPISQKGMRPQLVKS